MKEATQQFLQQKDQLFEQRKREILNTPDQLVIRGTTYYVCNGGDDAADGKTPETAWKTLKRVSEAYLNPGDGVLFKRGDLFRGMVMTKPGVSYGAYGEGEKPKFYGSECSLADPALWELYNEEHHIWKCTKKLLDSGTLVFNGGEFHSRKLIPTYKNLQFVCREDESRPFIIEKEMTQDLDLFCHDDSYLTRIPSKGEDFPVPMFWERSFCTLYLRCDKGNPGEVFEEIESVARTHMFKVGSNPNVTIDNVCIKYVGMHGVSAGGYVVGLTVTNCEMGWIGGSIQHYAGTDPNYPEGGRGTVTRFGNAIEIYGGCEKYTVTNNYIYQVYDAAITHQVSTRSKCTMTGIRYTDNVIEKCVYGIEYFLEQLDGEQESCMDDIIMSGNFIRLGGYGWGQQRHNFHTPALIKGWSYTNTARNYTICDNIFDRCAYRILHLVALKNEYCPEMYGNTFIQHLGGKIGQYGGNETAEPENLTFDETAEEKIHSVFGDQTANVYYIK
ncbi:MAG: hypothetical protein IJ043_04595 [Clostridia bacterium]|nr:hypothetical protein [Clostridia bacterium]